MLEKQKHIWDRARVLCVFVFVYVVLVLGFNVFMAPPVVLLLSPKLFQISYISSCNAFHIKSICSVHKYKAARGRGSFWGTGRIVLAS